MYCFRPLVYKIACSREFVTVCINYVDCCMKELCLCILSVVHLHCIVDVECFFFVVAKLASTFSHDKYFAKVLQINTFCSTEYFLNIHCSPVVCSSTHH